MNTVSITLRDGTHVFFNKNHVISYSYFSKGGTSSITVRLSDGSTHSYQGTDADTLFTLLSERPRSVPAGPIPHIAPR